MKTIKTKYIKNNKIIILITFGLSLLSLLAYNSCKAMTLNLNPNSNVVGKTQVISANQGDNFMDIGRRYEVGFAELVEANPDTTPYDLSSGAQVVIPSRFVLPPGPRRGIIINLAELRLYYYPPNENVVITEPVGIGMQGWETPVGALSIIEKRKNPTWVVPKSIAEFRAAQGNPLPRSIGPGPDNPLGDYALRLSNYDYSIHGTNNPDGVGRRISSGCIRMYSEDIKALFNKVRAGTEVRIINQPYKVGIANGEILLEVHRPLQEDMWKYRNNMSNITKAISHYTGQKQTKISWDTVKTVKQETLGIPEVVGHY